MPAQQDERTWQVWKHATDTEPESFLTGFDDSGKPTWGAESESVLTTERRAKAIREQHDRAHALDTCRGVARAWREDYHRKVKGW